MGSVTGSVSNIRYNGSASVPVNAGTYAVTADVQGVSIGPLFDTADTIIDTRTSMIMKVNALRHPSTEQVAAVPFTP